LGDYDENAGAKNFKNDFAYPVKLVAKYNIKMDG
jgi:hypothetical protein